MKQIKLYLMFLSTIIGFLHLQKGLAASLTNGSFESGLTGWTVVNEAGGSGDWFSTSDTSVGSPSQSPTDGNFYVFTSQRGPGSQVSFQDITLDSFGHQTLYFDWFARSNIELASNGTESYMGKPNQHFRVDLLNVGFNNFFGASENGLIANIIPDTANLDFNPVFNTTVFDLTPFSGQTVRLAFREVDNQQVLNAVVDNVRITNAEPVPEPPTTIGSLITAVIILLLKCSSNKKFTTKLLPKSLRNN